VRTRSAYMRSPWEVEVRDVELPDTPPDDHVLIQVEACGICGSDLNNAQDGMESWQPYGHEVAGRIVKVGAHCGNLQPGDKVVLESSGFCGTCDSCRNGRVDLCNKAPNFWQAGPSLGFSDYMVAPACCVVKYDGLTPEVACLTEPAGVAMDMVRTADIQFGHLVCLVGPGPIGLMAIPLAIRSGAERVVCIGKPSNRQRLAVARQLGAETIEMDTAVADLKELHRQFDRVLMTAPVQYLPDTLQLLAYGGILTYIGFGSNGVIRFDANDFHLRKLQLRASFASPALYYPIVLGLLKNGTIPGDLLISHKVKLADIAGAMHTCRYDKGSSVKVVVTP
jgi:L-iditol 2-dehydrogenase